MSRKNPNPEAKRAPAPEPAEADRLDAAVHQILQKLKAGTPVRLPGLGILRPGPKKSVLFDVLQSDETKGTTNASKKQGQR
jgi:hypothetical protein